MFPNGHSKSVWDVAFDANKVGKEQQPPQQQQQQQQRQQQQQQPPPQQRPQPPPPPQQQQDVDGDARLAAALQAEYDQEESPITISPAEHAKHKHGRAGGSRGGGGSRGLGGAGGSSANRRRGGSASAAPAAASASASAPSSTPAPAAAVQPENDAIKCRYEFDGKRLTGWYHPATQRITSLKNGTGEEVLGIAPTDIDFPP